MKKILLCSLFVLLSTTSSAAMQWVTGGVEAIEDYAGYTNGTYGILIKLDNKEWIGSGNGATSCTKQFRLKEGKLGMTEESKNRIFSLVLSAHMASKKVGLYVDDQTGPFCFVQIGRIGDK